MTWAALERAVDFESCPNCRVGQQAKREFLESELGYYGSALALPFALMALAALLFGRERGQ